MDNQDSEMLTWLCSNDPTALLITSVGTQQHADLI